MNSAINQIRKRDGNLVSFQKDKITTAISGALEAVEENASAASSLAEQVVETVRQRYADTIPDVEAVQDIVEEVLITNDHAKAAKAYILYRQKRHEIRGVKSLFGVSDDLKLSVNAIKVLKRRYLLKDAGGHVIETPSQMFERVARAVAQADLAYDDAADVDAIAERFYHAMSGLMFLPNSPSLMNLGTDISQGSACFVLPVEDSIGGIFNAVKHMALIHQSGGGTGFSFSHLRPMGDIVRSTKGIASGPMSFMRVFDVATDVIKQGGRRRGANMAVLSYDHPDIMEFISAKGDEKLLTNFNLSVAVTDEFMKTLMEDGEYDLVNPRSNEIVRSVSAKSVFDLIVMMAWRTGDPGLVFIDEINRHNPTPHIGGIEATNPCGEQPLLPFESCNLGSVNLACMVKDGEVDWDKLSETAKIGVHFLDNVIDVNKFPLPEIAEITLANRKIGLGVMGFAEMLIQLGIPYDSEEALETAEKVMEFISEKAREKSMELAEIRGSFSNFKGSIWDGAYEQMRNATLTTIAPTGTLSIIAGTTSGIEPLFAVSFVRNVMEGTSLLETNHLFEETARERGFHSDELMRKIARTGSVQNVDGIPDDVQRLFVTALDIAPEWHVRMQAAFQEHVDNAVSKTVNLPHDATTEDVRKAFLSAYELGCKGITIYRYGSKKEQVLHISSVMGREPGESEMEYVSADSEYAGGCPLFRDCFT